MEKTKGFEVIKGSRDFLRHTLGQRLSASSKVARIVITVGIEKIERLVLSVPLVRDKSFETSKPTMA